ncbi:CorA metal ion transporter [Sorochytrium milnesiophthora]
MADKGVKDGSSDDAHTSSPLMTHDMLSSSPGALVQDVSISEGLDDECGSGGDGTDSDEDGGNTRFDDDGEADPYFGATGQQGGGGGTSKLKTPTTPQRQWPGTTGTPHIMQRMHHHSSASRLAPMGIYSTASQSPRVPLQKAAASPPRVSQLAAQQRPRAASSASSYHGDAEDDGRRDSSHVDISAGGISLDSVGNVLGNEGGGGGGGDRTDDEYLDYNAVGQLPRLMRTASVSSAVQHNMSTGTFVPADMDSRKGSRPSSIQYDDVCITPADVRGTTIAMDTLERYMSKATRQKPPSGRQSGGSRRQRKGKQPRPSALAASSSAVLREDDESPVSEPDDSASPLPSPTFPRAQHPFHARSRGFHVRGKRVMARCMYFSPIEGIVYAQGLDELILGLQKQHLGPAAMGLNISVPESGPEQGSSRRTSTNTNGNKPPASNLPPPLLNLLSTAQQQLQAHHAQAATQTGGQAAHPTCAWWIDIQSPTVQEMKMLSRIFHIHPLTTEDILQSAPTPTPRAPSPVMSPTSPTANNIPIHGRSSLAFRRRRHSSDGRSPEANLAASYSAQSLHTRRKTSHSIFAQLASKLSPHLDQQEYEKLSDPEDADSYAGSARGRAGGSMFQDTATTELHFVTDTSQDTREKVEVFSNYYFICVKSFDQDALSETYLMPFNFYILVFPASAGVLTVHFHPTIHSHNVLKRIAQLIDAIQLPVLNSPASTEKLPTRPPSVSRSSFTLSPAWLAYAILDDITDSYIPQLRTIEQEVDIIDDLVLVLRGREQSDMLRRIGQARKRVMQLLRLLGTKVEVIKSLVKRVGVDKIGEDTALYMGDIQDHLITMLQNLQYYDKTLARAHSNYLAQISIEITQSSEVMNNVVAKLTIIASVVVPLNLVTGLWGMNVKVPGQDAGSEMYFWCIVLAMAAFVATLLFWIRRGGLI